MRVWIAAVLAVSAGILAWEGVLWNSTRREAWDAPLYWTAGYPVMILGSFAAGCIAQDKPWRWGLLTGLGQGAWTLIKATVKAGVPNLFPLGLVTFSILSIPCILAAYAGAWLGRRLEI